MIYPALTYLEEIGLAAIEMQGTKKRYSLTETGRAHYERNHETAKRILSDMEQIGAQMARARQSMESNPTREGSEFGTTSEVLETARRDLRRAQHTREPYALEETRRIAEILHRAAAEIRNLLSTSEQG